MAWQKSTATISCWKNDLHAEHTQAEYLSVSEGLSDVMALTLPKTGQPLQCTCSQKSTVSNLLTFSFV